jgi:hypothetical protein
MPETFAHAASHDGNVGIGLGRPWLVPRGRLTSQEISDAIKLAAHVATNRIDLDGVNVDAIIG